MPRLKKILPPTSNAIPPRPAPKFEIPDDPGLEDGHGEEIIHQGPVMATPDEFRPITVLILGLLCKLAKGEDPTEREIDFVNPSACAVANKYNLGNRWMAEIALLGSVFIVVQASRMRAARRGEPMAEPPRPPDRAQDPLEAFIEEPVA